MPRILTQNRSDLLKKREEDVPEKSRASPIKPPALVKAQNPAKRSFKEKIRELKQVYHDRSFVNFQRSEDFTDKIIARPGLFDRFEEKPYESPLKKQELISQDRGSSVERKSQGISEKLSPIVRREEILRNTSGKSENLSLNFSESRNLSTPSKNPVLRERFDNEGLENRSPLMKRIDFDSELNYSQSQRDCEPRAEKNDPVLAELEGERLQITLELEKLRAELEMLERKA